MRKIIYCILKPRCIFANILYSKAAKISFETTSLQSIIDGDMTRYIPKRASWFNKRKTVLDYLLLSDKVFRTVFLYRIAMSKKLSDSLSYMMCRYLLPKLENIQIGVGDNDGFIKEGLKIFHTAGCVLFPRRAGKNLTVFQGVTIGQAGLIDNEGHMYPLIGDNVTIYSNAVVFGGIKIGNNVTIGAGSIVNKDIPDNCVVAGNPGVVINSKPQNN